MNSQDLQATASNTPLAIAQQAFAYWKHGLETHDFEPFLNMLTEDCRFRVPLPIEQFRGELVGREKVREVSSYEKDVMNLQVTVELNKVVPGDPSGEDDVTVAFEWWDEGTTQGDTPYKGILAIFFDVRGNKISGFREYTSDLDPKALKAIM